MFIIRLLGTLWDKVGALSASTGAQVASVSGAVGTHVAAASVVVKVVVAVAALTAAPTTIVLTVDNPFTRQITRLIPGVEAITGPLPPQYESSILGLRVPQGVAVTQDGQWLYVAEGDGERGIKVIEMRTRQIVRDLVPPGTNAGTRKPLSVAVSPAGIVFGVDRLRLAVDMYNNDGQWLGLLGEPPNMVGLWEPLGVAVDSEGDVYVTNGNSSGPFVARYDASGRFITTYGRPQSGGQSLSFPSGMALFAGNRDYMFVVDSNNARVAVIDSDGRFDYTYGDQAGVESVGLPRGIFISANGRCYVTDATAHIVKVWDASADPAKYLFDFGEPGSSDGELLYPNAIAADERGRVYIADTGNDRVQVWAY